MPRSGSTLLQNILGNHPDFYASPTSGLFDIINSGKEVYTKSPLVKAQDEKQMKKAFLTFCRYGLQGYYEGITDKKYVIDKSRSWMINVGFLESFYPNPKVICMVRDLRDVVTSMEKNYRKHSDKWDITNDYEQNKGISISERVDMWLETKNKPIGDTLNRLKEALNRGFGDYILFVKFENLCKNPKKEMMRIHNYLEIPYYDYDFNNIQQVTFEDDKFHGKYGDHHIKSEVLPQESQALKILGHKVCYDIYNNNKWYFKYFNYESGI